MFEQLRKDAEEALQHQTHKAENDPSPSERKMAQNRVRILEDGNRQLSEKYTAKGKQRVK